jgi:nitrate reductase beta subunit
MPQKNQLQNQTQGKNNQITNIFQNIQILKMDDFELAKTNEMGNRLK